jgi:exosortase/archaeosortase family protein
MKKRGQIFDIIARYLILFIIGIVGTSFFYFIFTFLTIQPVYLLLKIFFNPSLVSNIIVINNLPIEIIGACIAGSAYYLLLMLNLSMPKIKLRKRIFLLIFSFSVLLILNILRIFLLSVLYVSQFSFFDITHKLFWYVGSIIFVVGIWFLSVSMFKIKEIPFYSDIKYLSKNIKKKN